MRHALISLAVAAVAAVLVLFAQNDFYLRILF